MTPVNLATLESAIIKPGIEEHLTPLLMYRGSVGLGRIHRLLNLTIAAMEQDCTFSDITQRFQQNPDFSHLCGPEKAVTASTTLYSFFGRLEDNPDVTNNIPHLLDYVRGLGGYRFTLERVSLETHRHRNMGAGGWRTFVSKRVPRKPKLRVPREAKPPPLLYPFLIHDAGRPEHNLLKKVNAAVPRGLSPDLRADVCQDLVVGILCGDFSEDNLELPAKEMIRRVYKMFPTKYGPISLDAKMGDTGLTILDTLSEEDSIWNRI